MNLNADLTKMTMGELLDFHNNLQATLKDVFIEMSVKAHKDGLEIGSKYHSQIKEETKTRKDIIQQAKDDLEELKNPPSESFKANFGIDYEYTKEAFGLNANYIINQEKRVVVCLLKGHGSNKVMYKGVAKCDSIDCFNAHIGKAIALRRALGLEVPSEYLDTPQPTEAEVGDVIIYKEENRLVQVIDDSESNDNISKKTRLKVTKKFKYTILDDSKL